MSGQQCLVGTYMNCMALDPEQDYTHKLIQNTIYFLNGDGDYDADDDG